jgi:hypothetical protein
VVTVATTTITGTATVETARAAEPR